MIEVGNEVLFSSLAFFVLSRQHVGQDCVVVGKCVFCHHRVAGNADPVIPVRDTFLKPQGGSGRAPSKHPSISGFHHNTSKKRATDVRLR